MFPCETEVKKSFFLFCCRCIHFERVHRNFLRSFCSDTCTFEDMYRYSFIVSWKSERFDNSSFYYTHSYESAHVVKPCIDICCFVVFWKSFDDELRCCFSFFGLWYCCLFFLSFGSFLFDAIESRTYFSMKTRKFIE